ncbi:hypothetical protein [Buchnera aphidicola]|nr:hypothetical protein [Buchnera aphidicola]
MPIIEDFFDDVYHYYLYDYIGNDFSRKKS